MTLEKMGIRAQIAARKLAVASEDTKNHALQLIARGLWEGKERIMQANEMDQNEARSHNLKPGFMDRLCLGAFSIDDMARDVTDVAKLPDPVGVIYSEDTRPNGLIIRKVAIPIGVIGVIYEAASPAATSDIAALCLKSGNAVILRGWKEAHMTNTVIVEIMRQAVAQAGLPEDIIQLVEDSSHESVAQMMRLGKYLDVLIPRGHADLVRACKEHANVPIIESEAGNCHIYVDRAADINKAISIIYNAKTSAVSASNAAESILLHKDIAENALPAIKEHLDQQHVILYGDARACKIIPDIKIASEEDWTREYLDYAMSVCVVDSLEDAVEHIYNYGNGHSECIVTENPATAERFMNALDSAVVYVNASTRFTDGTVFGFGAELGISTQKLHARGPIGVNELTTYKYKVYGEGQIRG